MKRFFETDASRTLLFQRLVLGAIVLPHGLQKAFGWMHGYGYHGTMEFFAGLGVPAVFGFLVIASDFIGSIALMLGAGTRLAALGTTATMLGATFLFHWPNGFFMNWGGSNAGEGFEMHLLALGLSIPLLVRGGGAWSVDAWLAKRLRGTVDGSSDEGAPLSAVARAS